MYIIELNMYVIVAVVLAVTTFASSASTKGAVKPSVGDDDVQTCDTVAVTCFNCTYMSICIANNVKPILSPCTGSTPNCNNGACSAKASSDCSSDIASTFNCPSADGHYPDPNDCRLYHICVNKIAADYKCDTNQVYSTKTHSCVRQSLQNTCQTVNCNGKNGQYSLYPANSGYAFFCVQGRTTGIMIACAENQVYDVSLNKCIVQCSKEGILADPDNDKGFIECVAGLGLNNYTTMKRLCPNNDKVKSKFDATTLECVPA